MKLPRDGQEYANLGLTGAPAGGSFEVKFIHPDSTESGWLPCETVSVSLIRCLVAGPDKAPPDGAAVVLPLGDNGVMIRLSDSPEDVIRSVGTIEVN